MLREQLDRQQLVTALLQRAYAGDVPAIREVLDRVEGRPVQPVEQSGDIIVKVVYEDAAPPST